MQTQEAIQYDETGAIIFCQSNILHINCKWVKSAWVTYVTCNCVFTVFIFALKRLHLTTDRFMTERLYISQRRHKVLHICGSQSILPKSIKRLMICDFITFHLPTNLLSAVKTPSFKHRTASRRRNPPWHFETTPLIFSKGHVHEFIYIFFLEDQMRILHCMRSVCLLKSPQAWYHL